MLNLVPISAFSRFGTNSVEPPVPPMITLLVRRSFAVVMPARFANTQVFELMLALPSQPKVRMSNCALGDLPTCA